MGPAVVVPTVLVGRPLFITERYEAIRRRVLDVVAPPAQAVVPRVACGSFHCWRPMRSLSRAQGHLVSLVYIMPSNDLCAVDDSSLTFPRLLHVTRFSVPALVRGSVALVNGSATDIFYLGPAKMCGARHGERKPLGHETRSGLSAPFKCQKDAAASAALMDSGFEWRKK
jgi:hypothetical protein